MNDFLKKTIKIHIKDIKKNEKINTDYNTNRL